MSLSTWPSAKIPSGRPSKKIENSYNPSGKLLTQELCAPRSSLSLRRLGKVLHSAPSLSGRCRRGCMSLRAPPLHPSSIRATAGHCYHVQRSMPQSAPLLLHEVQSESPRSSPNPAVPLMMAKHSRVLSFPRLVSGHLGVQRPHARYVSSAPCCMDARREPLSLPPPAPRPSPCAMVCQCVRSPSGKCSGLPSNRWAPSSHRESLTPLPPHAARNGQSPSGCARTAPLSLDVSRWLFTVQPPDASWIAPHAG